MYRDKNKYECSSHPVKRFREFGSSARYHRNQQRVSLQRIINDERLMATIRNDQLPMYCFESNNVRRISTTVTNIFVAPRVPPLCSRAVGLQMLWASTSVPPSVIPSSAWHYATPIAGSPFNVNVLPREHDVRKADNSIDGEGFSPALAKTKDRPLDTSTQAKVCTVSHDYVRYCPCDDLLNVEDTWRYVTVATEVVGFRFQTFADD